MIDIGANLVDDSFLSEALFKPGPCLLHHIPYSDMEWVLHRCARVGVTDLILTGGSEEDSVKAIALAKSYDGKSFPVFDASNSVDDIEKDLRRIRLRATVGCHPCRATEVTHQKYFERLRQLIAENRDVVVAVGECGLDYDRTGYCPIDVQHKVFPPHFDLAREFDLPLFLHNRNTGGDFVRIMEREMPSLSAGGVVHSFTGGLEEMKQLVNLGLYIGVNGCSMKTEENCAVVSQIPLDRLLLETDSPYCEIRPSHASYGGVSTFFRSLKKEHYLQEIRGLTTIKSFEVLLERLQFLSRTIMKRRNEPSTLSQVCEAAYSIRNSGPRVRTDQATQTSPQGTKCAVSEITRGLDSFKLTVRANTIKLFRL